MTGRKLFEIFEGDQGQMSMTRVLLFLCVMFYLVWASIIIIDTGSIPDIPLQLAGLMTLLYGINKGKGIAETFTKQKGGGIAP